MKIVIDRKKWIRGTHPKQEAALRTTYYRQPRLQCCLGFACKAAGMTDKEIERSGMPGHALVNLLDEAGCAETAREQAADRRYHYLFDVMKKAKLIAGTDQHPRDSKFSTRAMIINDREDLTEAQRESRLTKLFAKYGHTLVFIN